MANQSAFERIEAITKRPASMPYDAIVAEVFTDRASVRKVGNNQILQQVLIADHIDKSKLRKGLPVRLGEHLGQPIILAMLPQLEGDLNYAGKGSLILSPPAVSVTATSDGWLVTWIAVPGADRYHVYRNDTADETTPDDLDYVTGTSLLVSYESPYIYFAVRAVSGLNESEVSAWVTDDTAPLTPNTFAATNDTGGHLLSISPTDVALTHTGFKCFEIEQANDGSGTGAVSLGLFYYPDNFPVTRQFGPGTIKYYRIRAIDWAGNASDWTAWDDAWVFEGVIQDKFDTYGGVTGSALESLYWLQLDRMEAVGAGGWDDNSIFSTTLETSLVIEGDTAIRVTNTEATPQFITLSKNFVPALDLSVEGRFTSDDYVTIAAYIPAGANILGVQFTDGAVNSANRFTNTNIPALVTGWNYLKLKRSDFNQVGSPNWNSIDWFSVIFSNFPASPAYAVVDDLRIIKADPGDATTYNDTGTAWDRAANTGTDVGEWHIYPGNRTGEPAKPFSYGQIKTAASPAVWYLSHKPLATINIATGTIQSGMYLKGADGKGGLAFFIKDVSADSWDMYAIEADSAGDTVKLVKWVGGTRTEIASAAFTFAPDQILWLGADFREYDADAGRIKIYAAFSEGNLIQAANMIISAQDTAVGSGGSVGVLSYQANLRYVNFVAGSPAHADVADVARALDGPILAGETRRVRFNPDTLDFEVSNDGQTWIKTGLLGEIKLWPTNTAPAGWLLCYGQAISRSTYAALFNIIGTTFGTGDGSTTFNLPDMRGRFPLGQDDMGGSSANRVTATEADNLGQGSGAETHTLTVSEMPSHHHITSGGLAFASGAAAYSDAPTGSTLIRDTTDTGGDGAHNNMPPYLTVNYVIYAGV